ncbi:MAG: hypothetical protein KC620_05170 [Myxococcales bacterium]|nr:hypothetical protein [Myxococcales bacterium]
MLTQPAIDGWLIPRIESIRAVERRRLVALSVPGLAGDLSQDLGRAALWVEVTGSLYGDEARDAMLLEVRDRFAAGEPVDFVADLVHETELEQVVIERFEVTEVAGSTDSFRYRIVLREYVEPPPPPSPGLDDFGLDVDADLGLDVDLGLDLLDLPALLVSVPDLPALEEALAPVEEAAAKLRETLGGAAEALKPLSDLFGD